MCMIVYRPVSAKSGRGANIPGSVIDTALTRHPDGFGVAYREAGELRVERFGPREGKRFRKALKRVDRGGGEYVAHFRYATHGAKDAVHAHPYEYNDPDPKVGRVLVFHNGVIDIATKGDDSDTQVFVRDVLATLPSRWWESPALRYLVNAAIDWSKLTLMTATETVNLHDARGTWDQGIWYSSTHTPTPKWTGSKAVSTYYNAQAASTAPGWQHNGYRPTTPSAGRDVAMALRDMGGWEAEPDIDRPYQYRHGGHALSAMVDIDRAKDGDYLDAVICDTCFTTGDVYVIDGGMYIDMAHKDGLGDVEDEREEEVIYAR